MKKEGYNQLVSGIGQLLNEGRQKAVSAVNRIITITYWQIGKMIVEFEQKGKKRAIYGGSLIESLSQDLTKRHGKGFTISNLKYMRQFYLACPISHALRGELNWTHYRLLLHVKNKQTRDFYTMECMNSRWSTRELERQINTQLYERLALSRDKKEIMALSTKGQAIQKPEDIIKDPYVLEFLDLPSSYSEKELEDRIISNLQMFLLELGKGFSFVARQFRMEIGQKQFYADLVFYNKNLRCYVLIDLKISSSHADIGQMNFYLNYFKRHVNQPTDNAPIGIILSKNSTSIEVKYALGGLSNKIFASKYMLSLPSVEELKKAVEYNNR
jgi:predicted nuclease of restriction endonuclease-like (RecB) superfamily